MNRSIGGTHSALDLYHALGARDRHRPTDSAGIVAAIRDMARRGLTSADIGAVLGLAVSVVEEAMPPPRRDPAVGAL